MVRRRPPALLALALALAGCPRPEVTDPTPKDAPKEAVKPAPAAARGPQADDGFRMPPAEVPVQDAATEAPMSLTASDGAGLELVALDAKGVVEGPLAFTELHLRFRNPEPRVREGRFRVVLPEGASMSRFAMKIRDRWQEGEVVERQKARRTYEDFLHRRQDPALLEQAAGNEFTARVFPIPAGADKELIVAYSHELPRADAPYVIPLRGLPELANLSIEVLVGKATSGAATTSLGGTKERHETIRVAKTRWVPDLDFEVQVPKSARTALRHDNLVLARITPELSTRSEGVEGLVVLVDTSASRALGFDAQLRLLDDLVRGLARGSGEKTPLRVLAFDQDIEEIYAGPAEGYDRDAKSKLHRRRALGASDLAGALEWLAEHPTEGHDRLVLITDGVATAGDVEGDGAAQAAKALSKQGILRIDALAIGGLRDSDALARITTCGLAKDGVVLDGSLPIEEIGRRLSRATVSGLDVKVEGAKWVWPRRLDGVQPGDEILVYADLPAGQPLAITVGEQRIAVPEAAIQAAPRPLLERAWVGARIAGLLDKAHTLGADDPDLAAAVRAQVIELSTKHRVLSPYTALLVLETENDYRRYGIDRTARADILTVGRAGLEVLAAKADEKVALAPVTRPKPRPRRRPMRQRALADDGAMADESLATSGAPAGPAPEAPADDADFEGGLDLAGTGRGGGGNAVAEVPSSAIEEAEAPPPPPAAEPEAERAMQRSMPAPQREEMAAREEAPARRRRVRRPPTPRPSRPNTGLGFGERAKKKAERPPAVTGKLAEIERLLAAGNVQDALSKAEAWREEAPGDVLALVGLGEALEKKGDVARAARAYGSIIDLFSARADLLRFAAYRLEALGTQEALRLAADAYGKAVKQRKDHPSGHRGLAIAHLKRGEHEAAFAALEYGLAQRYPSRFPGVLRILAEDLGLVAAAWKAKAPERAAEIDARLAKAGGAAPSGASVRFVLSWETDANDVDFHIHDGKGGHAYYSSKTLPSGGALYADVTTGYGPECFTIEDTPRAFPYRLEAHYYRKGPMGYGMGRLQIIAHDGQGHLRFDERPFVVMTDGAYLDLGRVEAKWLQ